jgi:putative transposase
MLNHKTAQRLMKETGIVCRVRMKKYNSYKGEVGKVALNLLERNFEAEKSNQKWVTDVTEFCLFGQKLCLSPILDLCSRDIVSYSISDKPVLSMMTEMLNKAFEKIPDGTNLILNSESRLAVSAQAIPKDVAQQRDSLKHEPNRQLPG